MPSFLQSVVEPVIMLKCHCEERGNLIRQTAVVLFLVGTSETLALAGGSVQNARLLNLILNVRPSLVG